MKGTVDFWGRVNLVTTESGYDLLSKSLPKNMVGMVDDNGMIVVETTDTEYEFFSGGKMVIDKMIAHHFSYDDQKNARFQENIQELSHRVGSLRKEIIRN